MFREADGPAGGLAAWPWLSLSDRRLTPTRPDLAADFLRGRVEADRFEAGTKMQVVAPVADLRGAPRLDAPLDTQLLRGQTVTVYEEHEGWAWGQCADDGYVGYMPSEALRAPGPALTHRVAVARTFVYPGPNMKLPATLALPFGAKVAVAATRGDFAMLSDGQAIYARHLVSADARAPDFVGVAERFIGAPYLWGGKTPDGLDCSGLVQIALTAAGIACPRDTDMQEGALGRALPEDEPLARGDLVFWKGHVGIMRDATTLLHANGFHMLVESEPFAQARERIARASFGAVTSIRRLAPDEPGM